MKNQNKPKFTVIKGGNNTLLGEPKRKFISGYVTDTRLMGVVGLYMHWEVHYGDMLSEDLHQFFYLDAEEYGFESYQSIWGNSASKFMKAEQKLIGGLGGIKNNISEKEGCFLLQTFIEINKKSKLPLPEPVLEYEFILKNEVTFSSWEEEYLTYKMCTPLETPYQAVNYYLMRSFALDRTAADFMTEDDKSFTIFSGTKPATLCMNSIQIHEEADEETGKETGKKITYLSESLIDLDGKYFLVTSEISLSSDRHKIENAVQHAYFQVSSIEAAMMLNRPEYISLYEIMTDPDTFDAALEPSISYFMETPHDNGRLYMRFNANNEHVKNKVYRLNDDVFGMVYVSDFGQLILAAYDGSKIQNMEKWLSTTPISPFLIQTIKYQFKEPILYEFVKSDFEDFIDFLDFFSEKD